MSAMGERIDGAGRTSGPAATPEPVSTTPRPPRHASGDQALQLTDADLLHCLGAGSTSTELAGAAVALAWARCWIADLDEITVGAQSSLEYVATHVPSSRWSWRRAEPTPPPVEAEPVAG